MKLVLSSSRMLCLLVVALASSSSTVSAFTTITTTTTRTTSTTTTITTPARTLSSGGRHYFAAQTGDEFRRSSSSMNNNDFPPPQPPNNNNMNNMNNYNNNNEQQQQEQEIRVRRAYQDWCRNYDKPFEERRLPIFAQNFLRMEKYAQQTGEQVKFNEYADLTTEEYKYMLLASQQQQQQQQLQRGGRGGGGPPPPSGRAARPMASSAPPRRSSSSSRQQQQRQQQQQSLPISDWRRGMAETNPKGYDTLMKVVTIVQTAMVGSVIGTLCVLPITALDYLYLQDYSYTTYAQWQWDLLAAAIQGALFSNVYRTTIGRDWNSDNNNNNNKMTSNGRGRPRRRRLLLLLWSFIIVKSLVRITVGPDCASYSPFLYCAEPFYLLDEHMVQQLLINLAESTALFLPIATILEKLLREEKIAPYDDDEYDNGYDDNGYE